MSNLYKAQINKKKEDIYTRVIDSNELLEQKLSALSFEQEAKMRRQRLTETESSEGLFGLQLETSPELEIDYVERAKEEAAQIVSKATADAEEILKKAVQEAENLKESTRADADARGYAEGMERAHAQEAQIKAELDQHREQLEQDYADRLHTMEPELMDVVIHVFDQVLHSDLESCRTILLHLIRNCVQNIKNSREFRVRVSENDYEKIAGSKNEILQKIGGDVILDIMMDESMQPGQCTIDTDEGIFECGLDVQLENLTKDLRTLSCMD